MSTCDGCSFLTKKLRRFFNVIPWCRIYKCKAQERCVDYKPKV